MHIDPINVGNKKKKNINWLLVLIVLIVIIIFTIIGLLIYLKSNSLEVYIDGKPIKIGKTITKDTIIIDDDKVYFSIKDIARIMGYEAHKGEYKTFSEDPNKIYVDSSDETASFFLDSTTISKVKPDSNEDYQNYTISEPVKMLNNKMYVISDGFEIAFNAKFKYNSKKNTIQINRLSSLINSYSKFAGNHNYKEMSEDFNNQKALLYNLVVCKKESGKYGVLDLKGNEVISPKYNKIEFVEYTQEFIVTNAQNKVGIIYKDGSNKIDVAYDEIKVLDKNLSLYIVKSDNKYGVIDNKERFIIHIEYDAIGIDTSKFPSNKISNQYLLFDNAIPVKQNNMWGLFDVKGKQILKPEYNQLGCTTAKVEGKAVNNLLIIPEYKGIVVNKGKFFGVVDYKGNTLIPAGLDTVYSITNAGKDNFYMVYYEKTYDIIQYLDGVNKKKKEAESKEQASKEQASKEQAAKSSSSNSKNNASSSSGANATTSSSSALKSSTNTSQSVFSKK